MGIGELIGGVYDSYYKEGHPYKNYNLDKQGEGQFWAAAVNPNRKDDPESGACDKLPFWVPDGDTPKEPLAVSPKVLAEYAYDELPVPGTEIKMAPEDETKVNLPTWIWLDKAKFKKISVTASLPGSGLSATTTAEPVSMKIEPGTPDAETYPAFGQCAIENGRIGEPRAKGTSADTQPPCGVTYLRSSGDEPYDLQATVTWKVSWTSTNGEGGDLPAGEFGSNQDVVVQEIQSINR
jgi:enoyl reductase